MHVEPLGMSWLTVKLLLTTAVELEHTCQYYLRRVWQSCAQVSSI